MKNISILLIVISVFFFSDFMSARAYGANEDYYEYPFTYTQCRTNPQPENLYYFYKNHCTSYVAHVLNYCEVPFKNSYRNPLYEIANDTFHTWSDAKNWDDAARTITDTGYIIAADGKKKETIIVNDRPIPGDVAHWESLSGYGHVAWVEKVDYDSNGNATAITISEFNYHPCIGSRIKLPVEDKGYPDNFIHILAFEDAIGGYYLSCYDGENLAPWCPEQTHQEWNWILKEVNGYFCKTCEGVSADKIAYYDSLAEGGFGGGDGDGTVIYNGSTSSSKPELYVSKLSFRNGKRSYYSDETVHIDGYATNGGTDVSSSITKIAFNLYRYKGEKINGDLKLADSQNIKGANIGSGVTKHEEFSFGAPDEEDKYQIYAVIDDNGAVSESNESNNQSATTFFRVHKRPNLKLINLTIDNGKTQVNKGANPIVKATVTNTGGEPSIDVPVVFYLDGDRIGVENMRHWNIENGDVKNESIDLNTSTMSMGTHVINACAEFSGDKDQSDNCMQIEFKVVEPVKNDFNLDGISDILFRNAASGPVNLWFMNTDGTKSSYSTVYTSSAWEVVGTGDFNLDGIPDIIIRKISTGQVVIYFMKTDGTKSSSSTVYTSSAWEVAGTGDINADGISDIIIRKPSTGQVVIYFMNSNGTKSSNKALFTSTTWELTGTGDFNQDGICDIIIRKISTGQVDIWFMNADGTKSGSSTVYTSSAWEVADTGDFNQDGIPDIIIRKISTGQVVIYFMKTDGTKSSSSTVLTSTAWEVAGTGDYNADGISDIIIRKPSTGQVVIYFMNADGTKASNKTLMTNTDWTVAP